MSRRFEEFDRRPTPMGEISLRRRLEPTLQVEVYEAMLGEEHLMSSLFTVAEIDLARLALAVQGVFGTTDLTLWDWALATTVASTVLWFDEARKAFARRG